MHGAPALLYRTARRPGAGAGSHDSIIALSALNGARALHPARIAHLRIRIRAKLSRFLPPSRPSMIVAAGSRI